MSLRSILGRPLQGLLALSAVMLLTGAKGPGCGSGTGSGTPTDPGGLVCEAGSHVESVCLPSPVGDLCEDHCVPDGVCPPGSEPVEVCQAVACDAEGCPEPMPCSVQCVPTVVCPAGSHEEIICGGSAPGYPGDPPPDDPGMPGQPPSEDGSQSSPGMPGCDEPPPPSECYAVCVPDAVCPDGTIAQTVCDPGAPPPPPPPPPPDGSEPPPPPPPPPDGSCWTQ
ncbi:MAG: hypothetical protein IT372_06985, partial [Polyangiaceae bacterium]|nr:hypothetical protein [Polyangiaceae bacterium]